MVHLNSAYPKARLSITSQAFKRRICLSLTLPASTHISNRTLKLPSVSLHCSNNLRWCWNFNQLSIAYASRPRLRSRLTQGRNTLPWKPRVYGGRGFHPALRYSCLHTHLHALQGQSPSPFNAHATLFYHSALRQSPELRYNA